ncbi:MAG TPA: amidohydrolase family protein [Chloroflexota bacterium]|nr:amidohydrolase family protein [Chloroflexota bacterium]
MIINWHAHINPPEENETPSWRGKSPLNINKLLEINQQAGVDKSVVSNTIHYIKSRSEADGLKAIQRWDEYAAEVQQKYPDKTFCFASTVPGGGPDFVKELERAIRDYKLHGVLINSSHKARYPDEDDARGFWELVTALDIPVFVHAPASSFGEEAMNMYRLISSVGRAADECLSLARMIVRGLFEQFPQAKVVGAHLGGGICEVIGRMDYAWELQEEAFFLGPYEPMLITKKPSEYLKMLRMDSVSYHMPALMCAIESVGVGHMMFGADAPPLWPLLPRAIKLVQDLPLGLEDKEAILHRNAEELLGLE